MRQNRSWLFYLAYTLAWLAGLQGLFQLRVTLGAVRKSAFLLNLSTFYLIIYLITASIVFGIYLALPDFLAKSQKKGQWSFDWMRLAIVGIPGLLTAMIPFLYFYTPFAHYFIRPGIAPDREIFFSLGGIIFGHSLLASFDKGEPKKGS